MTQSLSVYSIILKEIRQFLPQERITRVRNLALLMTGLFLARHVHLPKLAEKLPLW